MVAALVVLAGCRLDVTADVTMHDDGTGEVTISAVADAELLARFPTVLSDLRLDDVRAAGWTVVGPTDSDAGGQRLRLTKAFVTPEQGARVLSELSGPGGPLRDVQLDGVRSFATMRSGIRATAGLDGVAALGDDLLVATLGGQIALSDRITGDVGEGLHLTVVAHLPGKVTATNGTEGADGVSASWSPDLRGGARTDLQASFVQRDGTALAARDHARWARIGLIVWGGLLAVAVISIIVWRRQQLAPRRRRR
jgi:hypothetical protein